MNPLKLPWWLSGPELTKLKQAAETWFKEMADWARWPLNQLDPETCEISFLNLLAWQKGMQQFKTEPLTLFRKRVKHAHANAIDAGSAIGFQRIFDRLGLGTVEINERVPGKDWDVIILRISQSAISQNAELMNWLIQTYGRTCRRYEWDFITTLEWQIKTGSFQWDQYTARVTLE